MIILGISAYYHDSSAALLVDGKIVSGALEERFSRVKHDSNFPIRACKFCLEYAGLSLNDIDAVVFYEKPFVKFERIIRTHINYAPKSFRMFLKSLPIWLKERFNMRRTINKELRKTFGIDYKNIKFVDHHLSHAANAYFQSDYNDAAVLVLDAVGEYATTSIYHAKGCEIKLLKSQNFPNSIGLLYSSFTYFLGFKVNSDEYKVMGLAPYGDFNDSETKRFVHIIRHDLIDVQEDGGIKLNDKYFSFMFSDRMVDDRLWSHIFGIEKRQPQSTITQSHKNLAFAIQYVTEEIVLKLAQTVKQLTNSKSLCLSGGCAMNCVVNGKLLHSKLFDDIYIPYAPDDSGCSIGAALAYYHLSEKHGRKSNNVTYIGPEFEDKEIQSSLKLNNLDYQYMSNDDLLTSVTSYLSDGKIVGWFQGRMEFGPRALGNRSILADPRIKDMKDRINSKIKFRESFRPFAPVIMMEYSSKVFMDIGREGKHMSFTYKTNSSDFPAITHTDKTSRVQVVSKDDNTKLYDLLLCFYKATACPLLLNTSFNVMGEPIVCSPEDAIKTFLASGLDVLIMNNFIVTK